MAESQDPRQESIPLISVIMPAYNAEAYIEQAVASVFSQEVPLELLVIDDRSTDSTVEILKAYEGREDFRLISGSKKLGAAGARNLGIQEARGEYIAFLDADDWWEDGKLAAQLEILQSTGCVLCCTGRDLMNPDGSFTGKYIPVKPVITCRNLLLHNSINCSSVVVRKEAILKFPMEHAEDSHEDYLSWLRILDKYGPAYAIDKPYLKYRLSKGGKSRNKAKSARMTYNVYRYMGFSPLKSCLCFISYALHGIWKYR